MKLLELFMNHSHYWGVPHPRTADNRLIQTCYGCSKDREVKVELRPHIRAQSGTPADAVPAWNAQKAFVS
jgi:hypothetical protein